MKFHEITYDYRWEWLQFSKFTHDYSGEGLKCIKFIYSRERELMAATSVLNNSSIRNEKTTIRNTIRNLYARTPKTLLFAILHCFYKHYVNFSVRVRRTGGRGFCLSWPMAQSNGNNACKNNAELQEVMSLGSLRAIGRAVGLVSGFVPHGTEQWT